MMSNMQVSYSTNIDVIVLQCYLETCTELFLCGAVHPAHFNQTILQTDTCATQVGKQILYVYFRDSVQFQPKVD